MHSSTIVLIVTGVLALIFFIYLIASIIVSQNKLNQSSQPPVPPSSGLTGIVCVYPGLAFKVAPPTFTRLSPKSLCRTPYSNSQPHFSFINHPVRKSVRVRSITGPIPTNHWLSNSMYGEEQLFNLYPYYGLIQPTGFLLSYPNPGQLTQECGSSSNSCPTGYADLTVRAYSGPTLEITSYDGQIASCDILDVDALVSTVAWQYRNYQTGQLNSFRMPLAKGCPFVTVQTSNLSIYCRSNLPFTLQAETKFLYRLAFNNNQGFLLVMSKANTLSQTQNDLLIPTMTGVIRLAYYDSLNILDILRQYLTVFPLESTIGTAAILTQQTWTVNTTFHWTAQDLMGQASTSNLLMIALPHHQLTSVVYESALFNHPILGPYRYVVTNNNRWQLQYSLPNYGFTYSLSTPSPALLQVWSQEITRLAQATPNETVNWCKWLGSLAIMILIGQALAQNLTPYLTLLKSNLQLLRTGVVSSGNVWAYDNVWGGVLGILGLNNCMGNSDEGNAYYVNHAGQLGYLTLAYAVAGYFDSTFLDQEEQIALLFSRSALNACEQDSYFPLWRSQDWYFGYALISGLEPNQIYGKNSVNPGENILSCFANYLLAQVLPNQDELMNWSVSMLAMQNAAQQTYFQFQAQSPAIPVNPTFVQGTINQRGEMDYAYTVNSLEVFPQRNATMMIPIIKPLTLVSESYLNERWGAFIQPWMVAALNAGPIEPESLGYGLSSRVFDPTVDKNSLIAQIVQNSGIFLPYGSTWTSMLYWILAN